MGVLKELNRDDLLNRFASHTFTETTVDDHTLVEFKDGGSVVIMAAQTLVVDDAYKKIREALVGTAGQIMYTLTETQKNALSTPDAATLIFESTNDQVECYNGTRWEVIGGGEWQVRQAKTVQTDNANATEVDSFALDDEETYLIQISVVGTKADGSDRCGVIKSAVTYRDGGGNATIQGSVATMLEEYSNVSWNVNITVSGNDVRATVTGVASTTINWKCSMQFIEQ